MKNVTQRGLTNAEQMLNRFGGNANECIHFLKPELEYARDQYNMIRETIKALNAIKQRAAIIAKRDRDAAK